MKAVIMAGGKGTRLNPLTCGIPKPMVPLLNKPCMEYIVELLKSHGITEIGVTVCHLSDALKSYFGDGTGFGVKLRFFHEQLPLGTAGSVKNMEEFLGEDDFLVISGDALTDIDLTSAIRFHRAKGGICTLVSVRVDNPTAYGVIMTDETGRIQRFFEKPKWSEVFSDRVNTGIYILRSDILRYIPRNIPFDFSKELFPLLMGAGQSLYAFEADGYWSDVGSISQYRQSQFDMLDGKVKVALKGKQVAPGIWSNGAEISPHVRLEGPIYLGNRAVINENAVLRPYSIVGDNTVVNREAWLEKSIVWNDSYIGWNSRCSGACIGSSVTLYEGCRLDDGSIVGDGCILARDVRVENGVRIYPDKVIFVKPQSLESSLFRTRNKGVSFYNFVNLEASGLLV